MTTLTPPPSNSDSDEAMDSDEDEVLFWGGESPRSRLTSPARDHEMAMDGSSEEDDDDSEDEDMSDNDDAEEDETDEYNRMEIFGHR